MTDSAKWTPPPPYWRPEAPAPSGLPFKKVQLPAKAERSARAYIGSPDAAVWAVGLEQEDEERGAYLDAAIAREKSKVCTFGDCDRPAKARALCSTHYAQVREQERRRDHHGNLPDEDGPARSRFIVERRDGVDVLECGHERESELRRERKRRWCFACGRDAEAAIAEAEASNG